MAAAPVRMMFAWVWVTVVTLARLNKADGTFLGADGGLTGLESPLSASVSQEEPHSGEGFLPVPVWKFVEGKLVETLYPNSTDTYCNQT